MLQTASLTTAHSFLDLRQDLGVAEEEVLLHGTTHVSTDSSAKMQHTARTSSPTLIELPPQPGRRTRSPALTLVGTTLPSLSGAPGPVAMTVASGSGLLVADAGRNTPEAVFCVHRISHLFGRPASAEARATHRLRLKPLDEDTVKEGHDGLDGLERCLGSLRTHTCLSPPCTTTRRKGRSAPFVTEDRDSTKRTLANVWQAPTMRVTISAGLFGRAKQRRSLRPRNIPRGSKSLEHTTIVPKSLAHTGPVQEVEIGPAERPLNGLFSSISRSKIGEFRSFISRSPGLLIRTLFFPFRPPLSAGMSRFYAAFQAHPRSGHIHPAL